jgi:hypothetical protein
MQLRHSGLATKERPKHCTPVPTREDHAIVIPDGNYMIPLELHGVTSSFPRRTPSQQEAIRLKVNDDYLELTSDSPEWDPHSSMFNELERNLMDRNGKLKEQPRTHPRQLFVTNLESHYDEPFRKFKMAAIVSKRLGPWNAELLAKNLGIGVGTTERALRATTRRGVREFDGNSVGVERRFPTGDRHLRPTRLNHSVYHDTLFHQLSP